MLEGQEHIARQREIVSRLEDLRESVTLQMAVDLLRNMEHAQMLDIIERHDCVSSSAKFPSRNRKREALS